jgi:hypothetical protein
MGCGHSRQSLAKDKKVITDLSQVKLEDLSRASRFEMQIPISLTDVEVYCKAIRDIHPKKKTLTPAELISGMSYLNSWSKVPADGIFHKILAECTLLRDEESGELSKNALLLWGIVLAGGKSLVKVKAFYDILQDSEQERISATDKDFPGNFMLMINLTTTMVNEWEAKYSSQEPEKSDEYISKIDKLREKLAEEAFLDPVFGNSSNLLRAEWETQVLSQVQWIFDSNHVRKFVDEWVAKQ